MAHLHRVYDTDAHFTIDAITRAIKNSSSGKTVLVQGDHNSERFTFEVPRMVDGHDLSLCNEVEVHYTNTDSGNKNNKSKDYYIVDDLQLSPDDESIVILSWLIHGKATVYAGPLSFNIKFKCLSGSTLEYSWNTMIFNGISVLPGIDNTGSVAAGYYDALGALALRVGELEKNGGGSAVRPAEVELLAANWLEGDPGQYYQIVEIEGSTAKSLIIPTPDATQILILNDKAFTIHFENEGGVITAFATGDKPTLDYTWQVHIMEVSE